MAWMWAGLSQTKTVASLEVSISVLMVHLVCWHVQSIALEYTDSAEWELLSGSHLVHGMFCLQSKLQCPVRTVPAHWLTRIRKSKPFTPAGEMHPCEVHTEVKARERASAMWVCYTRRVRLRGQFGSHTHFESTLCDDLGASQTPHFVAGPLPFLTFLHHCEASLSTDKQGRTVEGECHL